MDFISILSIFVLACFVGYYVVWSVTPALHTPLMSVTNAISSVIVVGALIAAASLQAPPDGPPVYPTHPRPCLTSQGRPVDAYSDIPIDCDAELGAGTPAAAKPENSPRGWSHWLGLIAVALASINIFGGFAGTQRMLSMYKKRERKDG